MTEHDNSAETTERVVPGDTVDKGLTTAPGAAEAATPAQESTTVTTEATPDAALTGVTPADVAAPVTDTVPSVDTPATVAPASTPAEAATPTESGTRADATTQGEVTSASAEPEAPAKDSTPAAEAPAAATTASTEAPAKPVETPIEPAKTPEAPVESAEAPAAAVPSPVPATPVAVPTPVAVAETAPAKNATLPEPIAAGEGPVVAVALSDPGRWGRVDAEGNVYVTTADGERVVGSWQAGEPEEGLAHFARRFDDIRTEVELLERRLASGSGDPKQAATNAKHIKDSLAEAHVVGDIVGLEAKLDALLARSATAVEAAKVVREQARADAVARKQALVEEAEKLSEESSQWKVAGDRLRAILDEWKTVKGVDRKTDEQLWRRFSKARDTFNRRRGSHFADLDRQRSAAKTRKQELVDEAEQLSESDDWGAVAGRYKDLMVEWKAAGRAPKDADDALWQRFRAAQDKFFSRRSEVFDQRDAEFAENARLKEELLAEADKINPAADLDTARAQLHRVQERWEQIGKVPRERIRELEGRLRAVEEKVRQATEAQWRRTDPEAEARAAQFRERVEQFEAQAAKARVAGDKRRAEQAEAQAAQWREWLAAAEQAVATR